MPKDHPSLAFITHLFAPAPGGMERWNAQIAEAYSRAGVAVMVLHFRKGALPPIHGDYDYRPIDIAPKEPAEGSRAFRYTPAITAAILRGFLGSIARLARADAWHVCFGEPLLLKTLLLVLRVFMPKPVIASCGYPMFRAQSRGGVSFSLRTWAVRRMLRQCVRILVDGRDLRDELTTNGVPADAVRVCHAGVDTGLFRPGHDARLLRELLRQHGLSLAEDLPVILCCCRLSSENAPADFIEALDKLDSGRRVVGLIAGDGPLRASLTARSCRHPVVLAGSLAYEQLAEILSNVSVCLLPYSPAIGGISQMVPLSMACGAAVVTTRVGDVEALVRHGENGLLVDPGDTRAMADAVGRLLDSKDFSDSVRRAARATIESGWSIADRQGMYAEIVREIFPAAVIGRAINT